MLYLEQIMLHKNNSFFAIKHQKKSILINVCLWKETSPKYGKTTRDNILRDFEQLGYGKGFGLLQYVVFSFAVIAMLPIDTFSPWGHL